MMDVTLREYGPNGITQTAEGVTRIERDDDETRLITEDSVHTFMPDATILEVTEDGSGGDDDG